MSKVNNWIYELDIADELKQSLIDADVTLGWIIGLDYQQVANMLHTDPYVGRLIVETLHNLIQIKNQYINDRLITQNFNAKCNTIQQIVSVCRNEC
jgi:hypothetical protein